MSQKPSVYLWLATQWLGMAENFELDTSTAEKKVWLIKVRCSLVGARRRSIRSGCLPGQLSSEIWRYKYQVLLPCKSVRCAQVPHFVATRWHAACQDSLADSSNSGQELGRVRIDATKPGVRPFKEHWLRLHSNIAWLHLDIMTCKLQKAGHLESLLSLSCNPAERVELFSDTYWYVPLLSASASITNDIFRLKACPHKQRKISIIVCNSLNFPYRLLTTFLPLILKTSSLDYEPTQTQVRRHQAFPRSMRCVLPGERCLACMSLQRNLT